jgi:HEAT repeat protein
LGDSIAVDALSDRLEDHDADVRFASARALGKIGVSAGFKPLMRALDDEDPDVVAAALIALGHIGRTDAIEVIVELLDHEDRFVRSAGAFALGELAAASAIRRLIYMMRNDPISHVRDSAATALCRIGGSEAIRALDRARVDCSSLLDQSDAASDPSATFLLRSEGSEPPWRSNDPRGAE